MSAHLAQLEMLLRSGPLSPKQLIERMGVSQPTLSRAINAVGQAIVRIGKARSIQYALRDQRRGLPNIAVHRVSVEGTVRPLGTLIPVFPEGFVMAQADGLTLHSDGLPWWLFDMRPQGFLGRTWAIRHGAELGLPENLNQWGDTHALKALLAHGHDVGGNLILGDACRNRFIESPDPIPLSADDYATLAMAAEHGDLPGSSAGGEQPKFIAFNGQQHVIVKFSASGSNEVSQRWRDLLLAEHHALAVLGTQSVIFDTGDRRFLEVERFDRVGKRGRRSVHSLMALDAEFVGAGDAPWPVLVARLANEGIVRDDAVAGALHMYAFGTLIGNTDMHAGNLAFTAEHGRPYDLAPAYDMLPMAFAPRANGAVLNDIPPARLHPGVSGETWRSALDLAAKFVERIEQDSRFSAAWQPCLSTLRSHIAEAQAKISRLD